MPSMNPELPKRLEQLAMDWRTKAERIGIGYRAQMRQETLVTITALETCAEELESILNEPTN